jgi:predicted acylesterase/phospholipase RssA
MLMGLLEAGTLNAFDAVYGASAGAINSTYFLSGAARLPKGQLVRCLHFVGRIL